MLKAEELFQKHMVKKQIKNKQTVKYSLVFPILFSLLVMFLVSFYICATRPIDRLFVLAMSIFLLVSVIPTMVNIAISKLKVKPNNTETTNDSVDTEIVDKKLYPDEYIELRQLIISSSKSKLMTRQFIIAFRNQIISFLGTHYNVYRTFTFQNDLHEIYTLIKSSKLTKEDYKYLIAWFKANINKNISSNI